MKQELWLLNSSLVLIAVVAIGISNVLQQEVPSWQPPYLPEQVDDEKKKEATEQVSGMWEKIYYEDIFGTYIQQEVTAIKQNLVTPIPEPRAPTIPPAPEIKKVDFVPPLSISLHGIIAGSDETKNVAIIADETNKEAMYYLGDKVKDAQVIKIAPNRLVILRINGQQETYYVRKDDLPVSLDQNETDKWRYIVKKIDDQSFEIDPIEFANEVPSLGSFIDRTAIVGTAYQSGTAIGIRVGKTAQKDLAGVIGLVDNDIITTVNDLNIVNVKNRMSAYDIVTSTHVGDIIKIGIIRAGKPIILSYKYTKIEKPKTARYPGIKTAENAKQPPSEDEKFKLNKIQQREQMLRNFEKTHQPEHHQKAMVDIRKRILDGLQQRLDRSKH